MTDVGLSGKPAADPSRSVRRNRQNMRIGFRPSRTCFIGPAQAFGIRSHSPGACRKPGPPFPGSIPGQDGVDGPVDSMLETCRRNPRLQPDGFRFNPFRISFTPGKQCTPSADTARVARRSRGSASRRGFRAERRRPAAERIFLHHAPAGFVSDHLIQGATIRRTDDGIRFPVERASKITTTSDNTRSRSFDAVHHPAAERLPENRNRSAAG